MTKLKETLGKHKENATVSSIVSVVLMTVLAGGSFPLLDDYLHAKADERIEAHMTAEAHLSKELIESISYLAEEDLSKGIDNLVRIQCETGADLHQEIKEKRKRFRKITGETYKTKTCDEL